MEIKVKKGYKEESVIIQDENYITTLSPKALPENVNQQKIISASLDHPIGTKLLEEIVKPTDTVAILTSDVTRPVPSHVILPPVLERLKNAGVPNDNITIYFAIGSHRTQTDEEKIRLVGQDIFDQYRCVDSNIHKVKEVGVTHRGTHIELDERVVESDRIICIGNVEFHYFAGYSGGVKALMPGMASPRSIEQNHKWMIDENAVAGNLETNPVRLDLEEVLDFVPIDFIVNVVLNTKKEVIYCASGHAIDAHRDACQHLKEIYTSPIQEKADIVIVSQGGAPKDINLYQMQKALDNSKYAVKEGGTIILVGACTEGFGQGTFSRWMASYDNPDDMIAALHAHFELGGHKATAIALVQKKAEILLVSDMDEKEVEKTFIQSYRSLAQAYAYAQSKYNGHGKVIVMPYGGSTLPNYTNS